MKSLLFLAFFATILVCNVANAGESKSTDHDHKIIFIDEGNYNSYINNTGKWFIFFYRPTCPHCKKLKPDWENLSVMMHGKVNIGTINSISSSTLASAFNVSNVPSFVYIQDGLVYKFGNRQRDLETWIKFIEKDHKSVDDHPLPKISFTISTLKKIERTLIVPMRNFARAYPYHFASLLAIFVIILTWILYKVFARIGAAPQEKNIKPKDAKSKKE